MLSGKVECFNLMYNLTKFYCQRLTFNEIFYGLKKLKKKEGDMQGKLDEAKDQEKSQK